MLIKEPKFKQDFLNGVLEGESVVYYQKFYKEITAAYASKDESLSPDTLMYEVYSFDEGGENTLLWGLTVMQPVSVNGECNLTRGHFHSDRSEPEIYFGLAGEGLLLYMLEDGEIFAEKVSEGSVHYIHGKFAHRLINTSDEVFKVGACWPANAGHDYEAIEKNPFTYRVYKENGEIKTKKEK